MNDKIMNALKDMGVGESVQIPEYPNLYFKKCAVGDVVFYAYSSNGNSYTIDHLTAKELAFKLKVKTEAVDDISHSESEYGRPTLTRWAFSVKLSCDNGSTVAIAIGSAGVDTVSGKAFRGRCAEIAFKRAYIRALLDLLGLHYLSAEPFDYAFQDALETPQTTTSAPEEVPSPEEATEASVPPPAAVQPASAPKPKTASQKRMIEELWDDLSITKKHRIMPDSYHEAAALIDTLTIKKKDAKF